MERMVAKPPARKSKVTLVNAGRLDMSSPAALMTFHVAANAYTAEAVKTASSAVKTLQREGILTKSGKLTKTYAAR